MLTIDHVSKEIFLKKKRSSPSCCTSVSCQETFHTTAKKCEENRYQMKKQVSVAFEKKKRHDLSIWKS